MIIVREDFLELNEPAPKIVKADVYDKMMARENYLNFTSATNSDEETVSNWNRHRWEEQGKEALGSLHTKFDHWKVGKGKVIANDWFAATNLNTSKYNADGFSDVAGKGKLCKAAGLTGAEKNACKKNIKSKCGHKPLFGKAKKDKWEQCASALAVTPEEAAKEAAAQLVPSSSDTGMSAGAKILLAVGIVGAVALIGFAIVGRKKSGQVQTVTPQLT